MCLKTRTQFYFLAKAGHLFLFLICFQQHHENVDNHSAAEAAQNILSTSPYRAKN
jgi:hypothetical protein